MYAVYWRDFNLWIYGGLCWYQRYKDIMIDIESVGYLCGICIMGGFNAWIYRGLWRGRHLAAHPSLLVTHRTSLLHNALHFHCTLHSTIPLVTPCICTSSIAPYQSKVQRASMHKTARCCSSQLTALERSTYQRIEGIDCSEVALKKKIWADTSSSGTWVRLRQRSM